MPGRISKHSFAVELGRAETKHVRRRVGDTLDHDVEVQLLRDGSVRPGRRSMVRSELEREPRGRVIRRDDDEIVARVGDRVVQQRVIARLPSRLPLIHEIRYGSSGLGVGPALGDGITYTGLTSGGGFEDALYAEGATPAGTVHGAAAVVSSVQGATAPSRGSRHLAWSRTSAGAEPG